MPRPPRIDFPDAVYHVTSRGNGRADIFYSDDDRRRFLAQLAHHLQLGAVDLYAFALMDNHVHLLCRTPRANLSRFMQRLLSSYALYSRYKHRRGGRPVPGPIEGQARRRRRALGGAGFAERTEARIEQRRCGRVQDEDLDLPRWTVGLEEIDCAVARHYGIEPAALQAHGHRAAAAKAVAVEFAGRQSRSATLYWHSN